MSNVECRVSKRSGQVAPFATHRLKLELVLVSCLVFGLAGCTLDTYGLFDQDKDGHATDWDCDDTDPDIGPRFADRDSDGFGSADQMSGCDLTGPEAFALVGGDCDDEDPNVYPGATEIVGDGIDQDCDGTELCYTDEDGDGYRPDGDGEEAWVVSEDSSCDDEAEAGASDPAGDCNDSDPETYPGASEVTGDEIDQDCDGSEYCYADADGDGYRSEDETALVLSEEDLECSASGEATASAESGDCADDAFEISPGAEEVCNGTDDDCNGVIDDGVTYYYPDLDQDGFGDKDSAPSCEPTGSVSANNTDCDDDDPDLNPEAPEVKGDGVDQDCDGLETCYQDNDGDGYRTDEYVEPNDADCLDEFEASTSSPGLDCDDQNPFVRPGAPETDNDRDDNCDGRVDDGEADLDTDGFTLNDGDCDDDDMTVYPGAEEQCNEKDDDCDSEIDEGVRTYFFEDLDEDRFGSEGSMLEACDAPLGFVGARGDCDDGDPETHPGAFDKDDDGADQDCGGTENRDPHVGFDSNSASTIAAALESAEDGMTIWVNANSLSVATYYEHGLNFAGKSVALRSTQLAESTVIDGLAGGSVFVFTSGEGAGSIVDGFTITGGEAEDGGGLYISDSSPTIQNCQIQDNRAGVGGGGVYLQSSQALLENCVIERNLVEGGILKIRPLAENSTEAAENGAARASPSVGKETFGGGVYLDASSAVLSDCLIRNNNAEFGGGVYILDGAPRLTGSVVSANQGGDGGGIFVEGGSPIFSAVDILGNNATRGGGGISMMDAQPELIDCRVMDNECAADGGGIRMEGSVPVQFSGCVVSHNTSEKAGGGVYVVGNTSEVNFISSTFRKNESTTGRGGGVFSKDVNLGMVNCFVEKNLSDTDGGGIYLQQSEGTLRNCTIQDNFAGADGGGAFVSEGKPSFSSCTLVGNRAIEQGGGIYLVDVDATIEHCVLADNLASASALLSDAGGGVFIDCRSCDPVLVHSILAYNYPENLTVDNIFMDADLQATYSDFYSLPGVDNTNYDLASSNLFVAPSFMGLSPGRYYRDFHLSLESSLVDTGDLGQSADPDSTPPDPGIYGGPGADEWDRDSDGVPDYFWPGALDDAPVMMNAADFDCDDLDPEVTQCHSP